MHGSRYLMRMQLEKERQEIERRREEEEKRRTRELIGISSSSSIDVPQKPLPPQVTVEVPPNVLEVSWSHSSLVLAGLRSKIGRHAHTPCYLGDCVLIF